MHKVFALLFFSFSVFSQNETLVFSLEEAIDYAHSNNKLALDSQSDIRMAELQKWETTATGLPQISADISYNNWIEQQISLIPAEFFGGMPGDFIEVAFGTQQTVDGTVTLKQKLFDGSYLVALQASKVYLEISKNAKEKTLSELRKVVTNAYGSVLLAEENISILDANIAVLEKSITELQKVYENGLTEAENIEQLQLTLSGLVSARNYNAILKNLAYEMFNLNLGLDIDTSVNLTDRMEDLVVKVLLSPTETSNSSLENNIDFKIAVNNMRSNELLFKLEKSKALPTINAFINGGYAGNNNRFNFLDRSQKWFGASLFGVNMSIPMFSSLGRSAATQKAKIALEKSERALFNTQQELKIKIKRAQNELAFAQQDLETKKQAQNLAKRIEEKNQIKFFEGLASSFELSQAQTQLYTAQKQYMEAMLSVLNKHIALDVLLNPNPIN
ncbi:MAG: TolC family protein [Flavobacteriaceae bacterium]|tara:strand:+ start:548 stop:1885 length:1338 start_codon:yes stop_codon:yes gene_type:complete